MQRAHLTSTRVGVLLALVAGCGPRPQTPPPVAPAATSAPSTATTPATQSASGAGANWASYLGDSARSHYSTLSQITKDNVARLQVAWRYDTGDAAEFQANPLVVDGVLYTASPTRKVIALDAATGRALWTFDPTSERPGGTNARQRGVAYWRDGDDERILTGAGPYLYALNAKTGAVIRSFGQNGSLLLGTGAERPGDTEPPTVTLNTPGVIYRDLYIVGGITNGPGSIRAFDVRTGVLRWIFHTIPRPGQFGYETWDPTAYQNSSVGAVSEWTGSALDQARGIVYVPTESATPDFWGGDRAGANLFANSLVALNANTGERLWHHQLVHHDVWDRDLPTPPVLLTVTQRGRRIDAVAQGTKHGLLFVFNRVTGEPLWPIEERRAPRSEIAGERSWPTQPFPTRPAPLMRQIYTVNDVSTISREANLLTSTRLRQVGSVGAFPGPSVNEKIMFPGYDGGMEWGGAAADPAGMYYVNVNEVPWFYSLVPTRRADGQPLSLGERTYMIQCGACHGLDRRGVAASGFPSLVDIGTRRTDAQVTAMVDQGAGRMPSFSQLPQGQRRAVIDWLFGKEQPAAAYATPGVRGGGGGGGAGVAGQGIAPPYAFTGFRRWLDAEGYPAINPPWGTLNAVDLNTGEIKWKVPLGEYPELTARGIPPTGTENYGGPVVTASGLLFIGATADETFRAFDTNNGKVLWQAKLPFGGNATPSTYVANGRQFVVISAGGAKSQRPAGGMIVAFALPSGGNE